MRVVILFLYSDLHHNKLNIELFNLHFNIAGYGDCFSSANRNSSKAKAQ